MIPKYRAWHIHKQIMCEVIRIDFKLGIVTLDLELGEDEYYWTETDWHISQVILTQSTGLKDKNGVEIYEGDIVHWLKEFISPMDMRTKLKIDSNKEVYQKESGEWGMGEVGNTLSDELFNVEVIGNTYENPELLEESL